MTLNIWLRYDSKQETGEKKKKKKKKKKNIYIYIYIYKVRGSFMQSCRHLLNKKNYY